MNRVSSGFDLEDFEPSGFWSAYGVLHKTFVPRQRGLAARRREALLRAHLGDMPEFPPPSGATSSWQAAIPGWSDQRVSLVVPADDAVGIEQGFAAGVPSVVLDLEDSVLDDWSGVVTGIENIRRALSARWSRGAVTAVKVRGIARSQAGVLPSGPTSAALFDLASIFFAIDVDKVEHPLLVYIPKSELAEEAAWWRDVFGALAEMRNLPKDFIKCMVMVESYPIALKLEEFVYGLRSHAVGLALGRYDYLASLARYNYRDPAWVLSDHRALPNDAPLFERIRDHVVDVARRHALLAFGDTTPRLPVRTPQALELFALEKGEEARALMDGTLIADAFQLETSAAIFDRPNRGFPRKPGALQYPKLLDSAGVTESRTYEGTRNAIRSILAVRAAALRGSSLSGGEPSIEGPATERLCRVVVAQRVRHRDQVEILDDAGRPVYHDPALVSRLFDEEAADGEAGAVRAFCEVAVLDECYTG